MRRTRFYLLVLVTTLTPLYWAMTLIPELATREHLILTGLITGALIMAWAAELNQRR